MNDNYQGPFVTEGKTPDGEPIPAIIWTNRPTPKEVDDAYAALVHNHDSVTWQIKRHQT